MDLKAVGQRIKSAREAKNLTQEELAALVNLSPTHVSVIERGLKVTKLDTFVAIANVLDVSADTLLIDVVAHSVTGVTNELTEKIEKLESVFLNILYLKPEERIIAPDMSVLGDLKNAINSIFDENKCIDVLYTLNTDKQFFGIRINPAMSASDATVILSTDEKVRLVNYQIEVESK